MESHAAQSIYYAARTVAHRQNKRDSVTEIVQDLVNRAFDEPTTRGKIATLLFGDHPVGGPPGLWPAPTESAREAARAECAAAARAARNTLTNLGTKALYTTLSELPELQVSWHPLPPRLAVPPAPLVYSLADDRAQHVIATLASYVFPRRTRSAWDDDVRKGMMRRLNAFAQVEINLWRFAADGGYTDVPPYTVRYDLARWLWHPSISGAIFCLRCGTGLRYTRGARTQPDTATADTHPRTGRCRACSRGPEARWPEHAIEPHARGTWILQCTSTGCTERFTGRRQARYCEQHRFNRITGSRRASRRLSDAMV